MKESELLKQIAEAVERLTVNFDHEVIDKLVAQGADIDKSVLVTSIRGMDNVGKVKTKHGILEVNWNPMLPPNTIWLMRKSDSPAQTL